MLTCGQYKILEAKFPALLVSTLSLSSILHPCIAENTHKKKSVINVHGSVLKDDKLLANHENILVT